MLRRAPVTRSRDGTYRLRISGEERDLLRSLPGQLREMLSTDHEALVRLFPPAYLEDPERDAEYRLLMREELMTRRLASLDVVESTLDADRLDEEQVAAWMKVLNDLRLVMGTMLDVHEDDDPAAHADPDDPQAPMMALYWFLSYLLESIVEALTGAL